VARLRFGVGRPAGPRDTADHVLEAFSEAEERELPPRLEAAARALELALREGIEAAANRFHRDPGPGPDPGPGAEPGRREPA
jgi:PTH1 family peptidyl-tRNA hydrolase